MKTAKGRGKEHEVPTHLIESSNFARVTKNTCTQRPTVWNAINCGIMDLVGLDS